MNVFREAVSRAKPEIRRRTIRAGTQVTPAGRTIAVAIINTVIALALLIGPADGQSSGTHPVGQLRVEWDTVVKPDVRPVVAGVVRNDAGHVAGEVLLVVETLDQAGRVVARGHHRLPATIPPFGWDTFSLPVPAEGAGYRVRVLGPYFRGGGA
jgi:hypothetical protein